MTTKLSDDLRKALEQGGDAPVHLFDATTNAGYVIMCADQYEKVKAVFEREDNDFDPSVAYPFVDEVMKEDDANDPSLESYQREGDSDENLPFLNRTGRIHDRGMEHASNIAQAVDDARPARRSTRSSRSCLLPLRKTPRRPTGRPSGMRSPRQATTSPTTSRGERTCMQGRKRIHETAI